MWFRARASSGGLITSVYIFVSEWLVCISESYKKDRKDIDLSNRLPRCLNFPQLSPLQFFISEREVGVGKARREREESIKTRLCTTGSPAFKQYKTKGKKLIGETWSAYIFLYVFLVDSCIRRPLHPASSSWPFFFALKVRFGGKQVSPFFYARPKRLCYVAVT